MRVWVVGFWLVEAVLLLPAFLLTATRLVEPTGASFWIQVEAFTPLAVVLYAAAALVALLRVGVGRRWRSWAGAVGVAALVGLVLHAWWYAPQVVGANPPPADGAEPLVVMTANLYLGAADGIDLVRQASEEGVDLLVVEEVTPAVLADMERAGLTDLLPYRAPTDGTSLTMVFSRQPVTDVAPVDLPLDGWSLRTGDLTVLAVHASTPGVAAQWRGDHRTIAETVRAVDPDLVAGDFNATADHAPMRDLAAAGYRDVGELANDGWQPTWPTTGVFDLIGVPLAQIDHVLVGPRVAAVSMDTAPVHGSDHRAVIAVVARK